MPQNILIRHAIHRRVRRCLPGILPVALAAIIAAATAKAADPQLTLVSDNELAISGGVGKQAWRLRYGRLVAAKLQPQFVPADGNRAWFSHGGWLRLIDTEKGIVTGRWHFPGEIVRLRPQGPGLQIEIEERLSAGQSYHRILMFDPSNPRVPYWPSNWILLPAKLPSAEVLALLPASFSSTVAGAKVSTDEARKAIPELEEAARRDPHSPWTQAILGRAFKDLGDARAAETFRKAIQVGAGDFTELMPISVFLDKLGESDAAAEAFERGYKNFWERGADPRLFTTLISRLIVYSPGKEGWGDPDSKLGRERIERIYRLMPYGEGAELAWRAYAGYLGKRGQAEEAQRWRMRADDARRNATLSFWAPAIGSAIDQGILIVLAVFLSVIFYPLVLYARYRPQHRHDLEAGKRAAGIRRIAALLNAQYWSRRERVAFLSIVFVGWYAFGLSQQYLQAVMRLASMPFSIGGGSYAGPANIAALEKGLPASPERDLMLALAFQQDGQRDKAAGFYRRLPQFPESWNNLGVILKDAGKDQEARAAFEKALQLDPNLAEAALNLGRPAGDFWTEQHHQSVPGRPMLAPPRGERLHGALVGGSSARLYWRALAGPFAGESALAFLGAVRSF